MFLFESCSLGNERSIRKMYGINTFQYDIEALIRLTSSCWHSHKFQAFAGEFYPINPDVRAFELTAGTPTKYFVQEEGVDTVRHIWRFEVDHILDHGFVLGGVLVADGLDQSMGWIHETEGKPRLADTRAEMSIVVKCYQRGLMLKASPATSR